MSDIAIRVEGLSKQYRIGRARPRYRTIRDSIVEAGKAPFQRAAHLLRGQAYGAAGLHETLWALKDVSFEVKVGEVLGIIGGNGSGKTTLLKTLSRITEPTEGAVDLYGRVGSLLEVGTGFHPELTGRDNTYLNGAILGMRREEIDRKFDEIVAFSEIEKFIDTPVKHYSSGMYVRLAFSVAAHLEPEILLVDEVLAVGDAAFRRKCLGKMEDVSQEGRAVLFVSHNMGAVRSLCQRALWLSAGRIVCDGPAQSVVDDYQMDANTHLASAPEVSWNAENAPGGASLRLERIGLLGSDGRPQSVFTAQEPIDVAIDYSIRKPLRGLRVVLQIRTSEGEIAFTSTDHSQRTGEASQPGVYSSKCRIPGELMNLGEYRVRIWAGVPGIGYLVKPDDYLRLSIKGVGNHGSTFESRHGWPGVLCPRLDWHVSQRS